MAAETYSEPGSVTAQLGIGPYWGYGGGANLQAGIDGGLAQIPIAPTFPLDLGVSARVGLFTPQWLYASVFGTAHYSWKALNPRWDWVNHLETYIGLGIQFLPGLSLAGYLGTDYHFDSHWAIYLEASAFDYGGTVIGASYKF